MSLLQSRCVTHMHAYPDKLSWSLPYYSHLGLVSGEQPLFKFSARSADPVHQIEYAANLGFAGIEDNVLTLRSAPDQRRIGAALKSSNLSMGCFVFGMAYRKGPLWNSNGSHAEDQLRRAFDECLESAERVRARYVTVVTGLDSKSPAEFQQKIFIENLNRYAPQATAAGLVLCLEAHAASRTPGMLLGHVRQAYEIARSVDSPAVKIVFDVAHVSLMGGGLIENWELCADRVAAVQLSDMPGRVEMGAGTLDFVGLLRAIADSGYHGPYELEHNLSEPGIEGETKALQRLRHVDGALRSSAAWQS